MDSKAGMSPYVRLAHDFRSPSDMSIGPCWINDHALHYFKSGSGIYQIGNEQYPIQPGVAYLVRPHVLFSICAAPGTALHMLNIHFDVVQRGDSAAVEWPYPANNEQRYVPLGEQMSADSHAPDYLPCRLNIADAEAYEGLFSRIHQLSNLKDFASRLLIKSAMLEFWHISSGLLRRAAPVHRKSMSAQCGRRWTMCRLTIWSRFLSKTPPPWPA